MSVTVQVVLPERADDLFSEAMRALVSEICARTDTEGGFGLGGENGYSVDYETSVFVMRRFYWGDCDCGAEERSEAWHAANPHADERGLKPSRYEWLCTCGVDERAQAADDLGHLPTCSLELPNFEFKPTGFKAEWYKWIGRDNKVSGDMPPPQEMLNACIASLPPRKDTP